MEIWFYEDGSLHGTVELFLLLRDMRQIGRNFDYWFKRVQTGSGLLRKTACDETLLRAVAYGIEQKETSIPGYFSLTGKRYRNKKHLKT